MHPFIRAVYVVVPVLYMGTFLACAAVKPACLVIDAAHAACAVVTVPLPDGGTETVRVSRDELVATVRHVQAARAHALDPYDDAGITWR